MAGAGKGLPRRSVGEPRAGRGRAGGGGVLPLGRDAAAAAGAGKLRACAGGHRGNLKKPWSGVLTVDSIGSPSVCGRGLDDEEPQLAIGEGSTP